MINERSEGWSGRRCPSGGATGGGGGKSKS